MEVTKMPGQDKTGPMSQGPLTGRGMGPCGTGIRRGFGRGMGCRRGLGFTRPAALTKEEEKKILESELKEIEAEKQAIEKGVDPESVRDYLNFFKFGCPPHGGFGFSPTRMLLLLLDLNNVREVTFLPRDTGRLNP